MKDILEIIKSILKEPLFYILLALAIFGLILVPASKGHAESYTVSMSHGNEASFEDLKTGRGYSIDTLAIRKPISKYFEIEGNLNRHRYKWLERSDPSSEVATYDKRASAENLSVGVNLWAVRNFWKYFGVGIGFGLKLTEHQSNKWLADSPIMGDISGRLGFRKTFGNIGFEAFYMLKHVSVPFRNDHGANCDMFGVGLSIPF